MFGNGYFTIFRELIKISRLLEMIFIPLNADLVIQYELVSFAHSFQTLTVGRGDSSIRCIHGFLTAGDKSSGSRSRGTTTPLTLVPLSGQIDKPHGVSAMIPETRYLDQLSTYSFSWGFDCIQDSQRDDVERGP